MICSARSTSSVGSPTAFPAEPGDLAAGPDQPAKRGRLPDDARVVGGVGGRRHERRELVNAGAAADVLELAALLELVDEGDRVDRLALRPEGERSTVDRGVALAVEVAGVEDLARRRRSPPARASSRRGRTPRRRATAGGRARPGPLGPCRRSNHLCRSQSCLLRTHLHRAQRSRWPADLQGKGTSCWQEHRTEGDHETQTACACVRPLRAGTFCGRPHVLRPSPTAAVQYGRARPKLGGGRRAARPYDRARLGFLARVDLGGRLGRASTGSSGGSSNHSAELASLGRRRSS